MTEESKSEMVCRDVYTTHEGQQIVVSWPASIKAENREVLAAWLDLVKRKILMSAS